MNLQGKHIVLGITGGIAAYKSAVLLRLLIKKGAQVQVVMTPNAKEFITPLTLATLSRRPVVSEFFDRRDGSWNSHVDLGLWADLMLIAPATAATIAKMSTGVADNMLLTTYLSMKAPVCIAPAMDLDMYAHPATQENLRRLRAHGVTVIEPGSGFLASSLEGKGRMQEPEEIVRQIESLPEPEAQPNATRHAAIGEGGAQQSSAQEAQTSRFKGQTVLITAGPTQEKIDDVRFLANRSTGLMGICLAEEFARRGAQVHLVLGPTHLQPNPSPLIAVHPVVSALDMLQVSRAYFAHCSVAVFAAAVADFRPADPVEGKLKRQAQGDRISLDLVQNPDIAATLGIQKTPTQYLVGFALEAVSDLEQAGQKLHKKHLDLVVHNSLSDAGAGFGVPTNKVTLITRDTTRAYPLASKQEVAGFIVDFVEQHMR